MRTKIVILTLAIGLLVVVGLFWLAQHPSDRQVALSPAPQDNVRDVATTESVSGSSTIPKPTVPTNSFPKLDLAKVPSSIRPIVDLQHKFLERQQMARSLGKSLKQEELAAIKAFLLEKHPEDENQRGHVLKNDLMDALCLQTVPPADLNQSLTRIVQDSNQNVVIRDYALQHLAALYTRLTEPLPWSEAEIHSQRAAIETQLWDSLSETDSSIAGTALLNLSRLTEAGVNFDRNRLSIAALKLAKDPAASELTRVTALQICARQQVKESLPVLVQTAKSDSSATLRISAIAALGIMGGKNELALLEQIAGEDNPRLKPAVTLALRGVKERVGQP